jgi:hypothetical protein
MKQENQTYYFCGLLMVVIVGLIVCIALISCSKKDIQTPAPKKTYFIRVASVSKDTVYSKIIKVK